MITWFFFVTNLIVFELVKQVVDFNSAGLRLLTEHVQRWSVEEGNLSLTRHFYLNDLVDDRLHRINLHVLFPFTFVFRLLDLDDDFGAGASVQK